MKMKKELREWVKTEQFRAVLYKHLLILIGIAIILITGCDLRKNPTLPAEISPFDYTESNYISVSDNYLVKSPNDDSYLFIAKAAVETGILQQGDYIYFARTETFTERDTLVLDNGLQKVTDAYDFYVYRDSVQVALNFGSYVSAYLEKKGSPLNTIFLNFNSAFLTSGYTQNIGVNDAQFMVFLNNPGCFQVFNQATADNFLNFTSTGKNTYLWHHKFTGFIPENSELLSKEVKLTISDSLTSVENASIGKIYPDFGVLQVNNINFEVTPSITLSKYPQIKVPKNTDQTKFEDQLVILKNQNSVYSLNQSEGLWSDSLTYYNYYLKYPGRYALIHPLAEQDTYTIPLDNEYSTLYLNKLYFNLNGIDLSQAEMKIDFKPDVDFFQDYYTGNPYLSKTPDKYYSLSFTQNSMPLEYLPDSLWIEAGMPVTGIVSGDLLYKYFSAQTVVKTSYFTEGEEYTVNNYTVRSNYLYFPLSGSGTYFVGNNQNPGSSFMIPINKNTCFFQTPKADIAFSGAQESGLDRFVFNTAITPFIHPWFSGKPYQFNGVNWALKAGFTQNGVFKDMVPASYYLTFKPEQNLSSYEDLLVYSNIDSWNKVLYFQKDNANPTYSFKESATNQYTITPLQGGYFIFGNISNLNSNVHNVSISSKMYLDMFDYNIYLNSEASLPANNNLKIERYAAFPDTESVLSTQYSLTKTSQAYQFTAGASLKQSRFYDTIQPYISILKTGTVKKSRNNYYKKPPIMRKPLQKRVRDAEWLFLVNKDFGYRLYTYPKLEQASGYGFTSSGGYNSFVLAYDGVYGSFYDRSPHLTIEKNVTSDQSEAIVSLYQNQFNLQSNFITPFLTNGLHIKLEELSAIEYNVLKAYQLSFKNNANVSFNPSFIWANLVQDYPYLYLSFPPTLDPANLGLTYIAPDSTVRELTKVNSFGTAFYNEFMVVGNSIICFVDNGGLFLIHNGTQGNFQNYPELKRLRNNKL